MSFFMSTSCVLRIFLTVKAIARNSQLTSLIDIFCDRIYLSRALCPLLLGLHSLKDQSTRCHTYYKLIKFSKFLVQKLMKLIGKCLHQITLGH